MFSSLRKHSIFYASRQPESVSLHSLQIVHHHRDALGADLPHDVMIELAAVAAIDRRAAGAGDDLLDPLDLLAIIKMLVAGDIGCDLMVAQQLPQPVTLLRIDVERRADM